MSKSKEQNNWWKEYIKDNPFKTVGNVSLLMGGILFLIYFFHIDYMPTLDIGNSIHLLFAMSLTGLFVMFILVGFLILPSLFWIDIPKKVSSEESTKKSKMNFFSTVLSKILSISVVIVILLTFIQILINDRDYAHILEIFLGLFLIVIINIWLIQTKDYIKGFIAGFVLLVAFMFFSKNYNLISNVFIKNLHLGGYIMHQALVKKQSCDILKSYDEIIIQSNNIGCIVSNLNILLKLGKETLIKIPTKSDGNVSIVIPSDDIVSYSWKY